MIVFFKEWTQLGAPKNQFRRCLWKRWDGDAVMVHEANFKTGRHAAKISWMLGEGGKLIDANNVIVFDPDTTPPTLVSGTMVSTSVTAECARHREDFPPVFLIQGTQDIVDPNLNVIMWGPR